MADYTKAQIEAAMDWAMDLGGDVNPSQFWAALENPKLCDGVTQDPITIKYGAAIEAAAEAAFTAGETLPYYVVPNLDSSSSGIAIYMTAYQEVPLLAEAPNG